MATRGTLNSEKFRKLLDGMQGHATFLLQPCDGLADAIERFDAPRIQAMCDEYTQSMGNFGSAEGEIDCLVLGCTHYAFIVAELAARVGRQIKLLDGGVPVARQTRRLLDQCPPGAWSLEPAAPLSKSPVFYSTGNLSLLESALHRWLKMDCPILALQLD
jgi:glutamate racemase